MQIKPEAEAPIFLQIAQGITDGILSGAFPEESRIPSITEFSQAYRINPATALKGVNLLVERGVLYKKRGLGMFVATGAVAKLHAEHRAEFAAEYVTPLVEEARRLGLSPDDIITLIKKGFDEA